MTKLGAAGKREEKGGARKGREHCERGEEIPFPFFTTLFPYFF
jgi:hypothetical protein